MKLFSITITLLNVIFYQIIENIEHIQQSDQIANPDMAAATLRTGDKTNLTHVETLSKEMGVSMHMRSYF